MCKELNEITYFKTERIRERLLKLQSEIQEMEVSMRLTISSHGFRNMEELTQLKVDYLCPGSSESRNSFQNIVRHVECVSRTVVICLMIDCVDVLKVMITFIFIN
jgi:hypothetical protein